MTTAQPTRPRAKKKTPRAPSAGIKNTFLLPPVSDTRRTQDARRTTQEEQQIVFAQSNTRDAPPTRKPPVPRATARRARPWQCIPCPCLRYGGWGSPAVRSSCWPGHHEFEDRRRDGRREIRWDVVFGFQAYRPWPH
jgi:hypothetical protein